MIINVFLKSLICLYIPELSLLQILKCKNYSVSVLTAAADRFTAADCSAAADRFTAADCPAAADLFRRSINPDTAGYSHEECLSGI